MSLVINEVGRTTELDGAPVGLCRKEFDLLVALAHDPDRVFTKSELLQSVWRFRESAPLTRTVDSHACRLRRKLQAVSGQSGWVASVWGVGYRLRPMGETVELVGMESNPNWEPSDEEVTAGLQTLWRFYGEPESLAGSNDMRRLVVEIAKSMHRAKLATGAP